MRWCLLPAMRATVPVMVVMMLIVLGLIAKVDSGASTVLVPIVVAVDGDIAEVNVAAEAWVPVAAAVDEA